MAHRFHERIDKFVGVAKPPTLAISAFAAAEFSATRVQWQKTHAGQPVQFDRADGYMVCLQRLDVPEQPYWIDQRAHPLRAMRRGQFLLLDLTLQHSSIVPSAVDCISIYTSREALTQFQEEHDLPTTGQLRTSFGATYEDGVVRNLAESLLPAIEHVHAATRLYADHVALALLSRLLSQHGVNPHSVPSAPRGGLTQWQERRAKEMLMASIDGGVSLKELASECRLSRSHFARAFKATTGMSALRWLNVQRVEHAKALLLNSSLSLEHVAGACGYTDASHLTRAFRSLTGVPPGSWRRSRGK